MDEQPFDVKTGEAPPQAGEPVREEEASTLSDMVADGFQFFTPALLVTHGLFDRDPVVEFNRTMDTTDDSERPFAVDCEHPFFSGLGKGLLNGQFVDWDHRLYGIVGEHWEQLLGFLNSLAWHDPKRYNYAKVGSHDLTIVDPTKFYGHGGVLTEIPVLPITVFCVSGYRNFFWIRPAKDPPRDLATVQVDPPMEDIAEEAEAILGPPPNPERIVEYRSHHENQDPPAS